MNGVVVCVVNFANQGRDLLIEPVLRDLNLVPEDQVFAKYFLQQEFGHHILHVVEGLRHHESLSHIFVVGFQMSQCKSHYTSRASHINIHHFVFLDG